MVTTETTLSKDTYAVYKRVPRMWFDEDVVKQEIAAHTDQTLASIARRFARLWQLGLIEFRDTGKSMPAREVRKTGQS